MNTVRFDTYNSFEDFGLVLSGKSIGAPAPKLLSVDIPCGDGALDYTDYFGRTNYYNRELSFDFTVAESPREFLTVYSRLQNLLNGRKMKITLSEDPLFYYVGRVSVDDWKSEKNIGKVTIKVNAEPYKLKHALTVIYRTVDTETFITCHNLRKAVIPKITITTDGGKADIYTFKQSGGNRILLAAGVTGVCPNSPVFEEGENIIIVRPTAGATLPVGVRIEYQEGGL